MYQTKRKKSPVQALCKMLKKWKQNKFPNNGNATPPSISLTVKARNAFAYKAESDRGIQINIAEVIKASFTQQWDQGSDEQKWSTEIPLQVQPY